MAKRQVPAKTGKKEPSKMKKRETDPRIISAADRIEDGIISTGCLALDLIMGGGVYYGRPAEFFGDYSTGKSLVLAHVIREAQRTGATVLLNDSEGSYMKSFGESLGIDNVALRYTDVRILEDASDLIMSEVERLRKKEPSKPVVAVIDSLAKLIPRHRMEADLEKADLSRAQLLKRVLEKWSTLFDLRQVAIVWANQQWERIPTGWQPPGQTLKPMTSGGKAPRYWANVRVELSRGAVLREGTRPKAGEPDRRTTVGEYIRAICERSKVGPSHGHCSLLHRFGQGLDRMHGLWDALVRTGRLTEIRNGTWKLVFKKGGDEVEFEQTDFEALVEERPEVVL